MKNFKKAFMILSVFVFAFALLVGCGQSNLQEAQQDTGTKTETEDQTGAVELEGSVVVDGSGTVYPFMSKMAENYMTDTQPNVSVEVSRSGTSAGFKKFLVAENGTDFNDASRKIKDEEAATAKELGIEVKELKVALDGLTIVINPENTWAKELTQQEVIDIFLASASKNNWSDVRDGFPNEPIKRYGPNENHGTYEFFFENILDEQDLAESNLQQEYSTLVDLVSKDKNAIGFFGYGYYVNNKDKLTAVKVDFGNGPVEPTLDTIKEDGAYAPFTRPVFTYLNVNMAKEKPQVLDYAIYTMNNAAQVAAETGFAPLTEAEIQTVVGELEALK